jgi:polysaccharide export outer membrane protein
MPEWGQVSGVSVNLRYGIAAALSSILLGGCTTASVADKQPATTVASNVTVRRNEQLPPPTLNQSNPKEYLIGPLDVINVAVFQAPELTGDFQVSSDGAVTIPLIGDVKTSGFTSQQVQRDIATRLRASYMQSPQVSVKVSQFNSQKVTVDGAVTKPGTFPVTAGGGTLLDFIAQAGGMPRTADPSGVLVFRVVGSQKLVGRYDVASIRTGQSPDPLVYGGDKIVVAQSGIRNAWSDLLSVIPIASFATGAL